MSLVVRNVSILPRHARPSFGVVCRVASWSSDAGPLAQFLLPPPPPERHVSAPPFPKAPLTAKRIISAKEARVKLIEDMKVSINLPLGYPTLPVIPERPPSPVNWVSIYDARMYLRPLFQRGWSVYTWEKQGRLGPAHLYLSKRFLFKADRYAQLFFLDVNEVVKKMGHDPEVNTLVDNEVLIRMNTHDAYLPQLLRSDEAPRIAAGITMHDVRLAMRLELVWERYWHDGTATLPRKGTPFPGEIKVAVRHWGRLAMRYYSLMHEIEERIQKAAHPYRYRHVTAPTQPSTRSTHPDGPQWAMEPVPELSDQFKRRRQKKLKVKAHTAQGWRHQVNIGSRERRVKRRLRRHEKSTNYVRKLKEAGRTLWSRNGQAVTPGDYLPTQAWGLKSPRLRPEERVMVLDEDD